MAYQFPNRDISESLKDQTYHINWAKAIYELWENDRTAISSFNRDYMALMRAYGNGDQPMSLYIDKPSNHGIGNRTTDRDGDWNIESKQAKSGENSIDYQIVSFMPRIKNKLKGALDSYSHNIIVNAIDVNSGALKQERKWQVWAMKEHGGFIKQLKENAGIPFKEELFIPNDTYELELFEAVQGFKLNYEKAMQKLFKHTFNISNWEDIEENIQDDLIDFRWAIAKVYLDEEDNKFKAKYVDACNSVIPYNANNDYTQMPFAGHFEMMTISDIRIRMSELTEDEIYNIANNMCGKYGNPAEIRNKKMNADGSYPYDSFKVDVFHCEWIDWTTSKKLYYKSTYNRLSAYILSDEDKEEPKPGKKEIKETITRKLRKCSWLIGTDYCYEYGYANLTDRPQANKVVPNYIVVRLKNKSITEVLRPIMDDVELAYIKYQDGRQMAFDAGYAIDFSMLQNISDGERQYAVDDILTLWREYKILLFQNSLSGKWEGGAVKPIFEIPGTAGQLIKDAVMAWDLALKKIMDLTGISPVALGATPAPGESATATQLSTIALNDIIKPIARRLTSIKERTAASLIRRLQLALRVRDDIVQAYIPVIGDIDVEALKQAEKTHVQYGFILRAKPDEQEKQALLRMADISLNNRRDGKPGIDSATYAYIVEQILNDGDLKELRMIISYQEKKAREEIAEQQRINIETQNRGIQEQTVLKAQGEQQTLNMKTQGEIAANREKVMGEILKNYLSNNPEQAERILTSVGMLSGTEGSTMQ